MDERKLNLPDWMLIYAFRYCLGRATYATGEMSDWLLKNWYDLPCREQDLIIKEIKMADKNNAIGMDIDRKLWMRLLEDV